MAWPLALRQTWLARLRPSLAPWWMVESWRGRRWGNWWMKKLLGGLIRWSIYKCRCIQLCEHFETCPRWFPMLSMFIFWEQIGHWWLRMGDNGFRRERVGLKPLSSFLKVNEHSCQYHINTSSPFGQWMHQIHPRNSKYRFQKWPCWKSESPFPIGP